MRNLQDRKTIVVGMSGGVDSSVSALLLKQQGHHVIGLFMKNWEETSENGQCTSAADFDDVRKVCEQIDIPYYTVNFTKDYQEQVFKQFLKDFERGWTPNPDILCNREIKFKVFLNKAKELGADFLATGHYAQIADLNGQSHLLVGQDSSKDQTYFLYTLTHDILDQVLFPIGHLEKTEVRELARRYHLATSEKKDSTGICFIGERHFRTFLSQYIGAQPGNFETLDGKVVGTHNGAAFYTLGQRKGMGIGGAGEAWFVVGKNVEKKVVYVAQGTNHPALFCEELEASDLSWVTQAPSSFPFPCQAKVRYRQTSSDCEIISLANGCLKVRFLEPQRAVTPGQSIVFYQNNICLGGGVITQPGASYYKLNKSLLSNYRNS